MDRAEDKTLIFRYILGEVSPEERADLEELYFADGDRFEELVAAENDLIDSYARGELSGPDRFRFEARFLATPELRKRVQFARSLAGHVSADVPLRPALPWWKPIQDPGLASLARFAVSGVVLGLLAFSAWLTTSNIRLRREIEQMSAQHVHLQQQQQDAQRQIADLNAQVQRLQASGGTHELAQLGPPGRPVISLTLSPGLPRSSGKVNILPVASGVSTVLLLLKTGASAYSSYGVSLETPEGKQIFQKSGLQAVRNGSGNVVCVSVPSSTLPRGDYILRLIGAKPDLQSEDVDAYSFRRVSAR
jgi:anti-sigma factor RsiW